MSKLETNTIDTVSGTTNLVIGSTNTSTITMPNGALSGQNYPAFEAYLSANQTPSNGIFTKVQFNTETFDTDNDYDNSTNYRFTPTVAGKYFVTGHVQVDVGADSMIDGIVEIYKNGSTYRRARDNPRNGAGERQLILHTTAIIDMNGSSDYLEIIGYLQVSSGTGVFTAEEKGTYFSAYRIGA